MVSFFINAIENLLGIVNTDLYHSTFTETGGRCVSIYP